MLGIIKVDTRELARVIRELTKEVKKLNFLLEQHKNLFLEYLRRK